MINYRVQNIEGLVNNLKDNGVAIVDSIETYDYGKFVHSMDAEGNKIELWEPIQLATCYRFPNLSGAVSDLHPLEIFHASHYLLTPKISIFNIF